MFYLVNCEVIHSYNTNDREVSQVNHIVEAESEEQAQDKVQEYYSKKDSDYNSYWVNFNYCN